jgi:hypothetical protein
MANASVIGGFTIPRIPRIHFPGTKQAAPSNQTTVGSAARRATQTT